jgi:NADH-quinone oxidoreductase subunit M
MPALFSVLLPAAGLYGFANLSRELPAEMLRAVSVLALGSALYGSLKALGQVRVPELLAYASLAFYAALWWHFTAAGNLLFPAIVYAGAVALLTAGLLLAWLRLRRRYGNLTLDGMHGLARPMPRFAAVFSLFVMAAVGLPPFALFFGHIEMLLQRSFVNAPGLLIILTMWFLASWYLFRMMQRLLFGPQRVDMRYEDLRSGEVVYFAAILVILAILGLTPPAMLESSLMINGHRTAMEMMLWKK